MTSTLAMLMDAYRELNARRLFWVTLAISGMVVITYSSIGFDDKGLSLLFGLFHVESDFIRAGSPLAVTLYRGIFSSFMVSLWLAWAATILALISTTSIFPDFMAGGAIDIVLSKPISRVRLFAVKYLASLLFVILQVSVFCIGVFFCLGFRVGEWNWKIFAAVPLVTVFYSYLFSVNVLAAVVTRSAITALLATLLFWFLLFGMHTADDIMSHFSTQMRIEMERANTSIDAARKRLESIKDSTAERTDVEQQRLESSITELEQSSTANRVVVDRLDKWHRPVRMISLVLPKTDETIHLLDRWLKKPTDLDMFEIMQGNFGDDGSGRPGRGRRDRDREEAARRVQAEIDARSEWRVLGSSLLFELVILSAACALFVRRDY